MDDDPLSDKYAAIAAGAVLLIIFVGSCVWSVLAGAPNKLPDIALGSPALLHLIRSTVATALIGAVGLVLVRGFAGRWPLELSTTGLRYSDAVEDLTKVEQDIAVLQAVAEAHDEQLQELRDRL